MTSTLNAAYLTNEEMRQLTWGSLGENVRIHRSSVIVGGESIRIGGNVRIDPFSVLSAARIDIGCYVHVASFCSLSGQARIELGDFSNVSHGVRIFSSSDDYLGEGMTNPLIPDAYRKVTTAPVSIHAHAIIGAGSIILPGVTIGEGAAIGALSLVNEDVAPWTVHAGIPARKLGERSRRPLELAQEFLRDQRSNK